MLHQIRLGLLALSLSGCASVAAEIPPDQDPSSTQAAEAPAPPPSTVLAEPQHLPPSPAKPPAVSEQTPAATRQGAQPSDPTYGMHDHAMQMDRGGMPGMQTGSPSHDDHSSMPGMDMGSMPGMPMGMPADGGSTSMPGMQMGSPSHGDHSSMPGMDSGSMPGMQMGMTADGGPSSMSGMGMEQQPPPSSGVVYACPMHPEVTSDKPGRCPKCGMQLAARANDGGAP